MLEQLIEQILPVIISVIELIGIFIVTVGHCVPFSITCWICSKSRSIRSSMSLPMPLPPDWNSRWQRRFSKQY